MQIKGLEGMQVEELRAELAKGAKFVLFEYCISIIILTFKRPSNIYFIRADESPFSKGIIFIVISLLLGWWGFPWGPIYTITSLVTNFKGGKDVTNEVIASLNQG